MSRLWHILRLDRVTVQIALVVLVGGILSSGAIGLLLITLLPERSAPPEVRQVIAELATIARIMDSIPQAERFRVMDLYRRRDVSVVLGGTHTTSHPSRHDPPFVSSLARDLPPDMTVAAAVPEGRFDVAFIVHLHDGQSVFLQAILGPPSILLSPIGISVIVLGILMVTLAIWAALRIVSPMASFAAAVEQFGLRGEGAPLREQGTAEVRKATNAFNLMRERIQRLIEDRTRTVVTISHDLRTPLTRLRLRAEQVLDPALKQSMLRDMDVMEGSIASAVSYLREGGVLEEAELVDLPSLIETICESFTDAGFTVTYALPQRLAIRARPQAIARAITNLVENGTKYASSVAVRLDTRNDRSVAIEVEDDGPGIPDAEKEAVMQPFYRTPAARVAADGFGLGLAIAADVARLHGGRLTLHDRKPTGLRACLSLPVADECTATK